jgi:hypothetical protein
MSSKMSTAVLNAIRSKTVLAVGGVLATLVLSYYSFCYFLCINHMLPPPSSEKRSWIATIAAAKTIAVINVKDSKTVVIGEHDTKLQDVIRKTIHSIEAEDHVPAALYPRCVVIFRNEEGDSVVAVYTGKHIIIHGYYFMTPYDFFELFY